MYKSSYDFCNLFKRQKWGEYKEKDTELGVSRAQRFQTCFCRSPASLAQLISHSVQPLSHVQLFATPWSAARQAFLSITNSWSLPKLMSIELVMPSNHLILCHPLLLPSIFPSIRVFSSESVLRIRWPKYRSFITHCPGVIFSSVRWRFDLADLWSLSYLKATCISAQPDLFFWAQGIFILCGWHTTWVLRRCIFSLVLSYV